MIKREIIEPRWANEDKNQIIAKFKLEDGNIVQAAISVPEGGSNPDWDEIMETFGPDVLEENFQKDLELHYKRKEAEEEQRKQDIERAIKEALFNAKAEAFEIQLVKDSKNKALKNKIRKASTIMEVTAYTSALIYMEDPIFKDS
jgi:hypothetical protein